jgi:hypothetical protein
VAFHITHHIIVKHFLTVYPREANIAIGDILHLHTGTGSWVAKRPNFIAERKQADTLDYAIFVAVGCVLKREAMHRRYEQVKWVFLLQSEDDSLYISFVFRLVTVGVGNVDCFYELHGYAPLSPIIFVGFAYVTLNHNDYLHFFQSSG